MKKKHNKIDLPESIREIFPIKVKFGNENTIYDFGKNFDSNITRTLAKTFYERYSKLSIKSRERAYYFNNKFSEYLKSINVININDINNKHIVGFALWIDKKNMKTSSKYKIYQTIELQLADIKKIKNSPLKDLNIPANPFREIKSDREEPNVLNSEQIKKILNISYEKIDVTMKEFRLVQEKIEELGKKGNFDFNRNDIYHVIHFFYHKYGYFPFVNELPRHEQTYVECVGGAEKISSCFCPNSITLLPFYLVLLIELAANSDSLRKIKIDCFIEDPLFEDRCFIVWEKARATKDQKRNIFKNKKYGAYQIVQLIKELTQHIRKNTSKEHKDSLFIARGKNASSKMSIVNQQRFNLDLKNFIKDNELGFNFNVSDIRPSVLTSIYRARKDIVAVSKIANHKNINTTLLYVVNDETKKENREYLASKQDTILKNINKKQETTINPSINGENKGFTCKNPIVDKKVCINWMAELTNPELVIPASSQYLSKIIALKNAIEKGESFIDKGRFLLLYEPVLSVIKQEIIPKFSKKLITESELLAKNITLPLLEDY